MIHRLLNYTDVGALMTGTAMTLSGPIAAETTSIPGAEYLTPFGLLLVVLWSVGQLVRKVQSDGAKLTDDYIQALIAQNKEAGAVAAEAGKTNMAMTREMITCMESTRNTVQDMERLVKETQQSNTDIHIAINRQLTHFAEIVENWKKQFPCVAMQSAEGRDLLARKVKEKEAE